MVFYQIETEEVSDRFVAPCFVNGLEAYDGEMERIFKKKAKNDQTKHGMEKPKSVKVKSQPNEENTT
ncbi:hypothetical protein Tco_1235529 [Tanacetum coccineum]